MFTHLHVLVRNTVTMTELIMFMHLHVLDVTNLISTSFMHSECCFLVTDRSKKYATS